MKPNGSLVVTGNRDAGVAPVSAVLEWRGEVLTIALQ